MSPAAPPADLSWRGTLAYGALALAQLFRRCDPMLQQA